MKIGQERFKLIDTKTDGQTDKQTNTHTARKIIPSSSKLAKVITSCVPADMRIRLISRTTISLRRDQVKVPLLHDHIFTGDNFLCRKHRNNISASGYFDN